MVMQSTTGKSQRVRLPWAQVVKSPIGELYGCLKQEGQAPVVVFTDPFRHAIQIMAPYGSPLQGLFRSKNEQLLQALHQAGCGSWMWQSYGGTNMLVAVLKRIRRQPAKAARVINQVLSKLIPCEDLTLGVVRADVTSLVGLVKPYENSPRMVNSTSYAVYEHDLARWLVSSGRFVVSLVRFINSAGVAETRFHANQEQTGIYLIDVHDKAEAAGRVSHGGTCGTNYWTVNHTDEDEQPFLDVVLEALRERQAQLVQA